METIQNLSEKSAQLDLKVKKDIKSDLPNLKPLTDGIINIEFYLKAKYKILWVLKEPFYDDLEDGKPSGGGWDLKNAYNSKKNIISDFHRKTFDRMIFTSFGLLNNFCSWEETTSKLSLPEIIEAFKSTAYINVKKTQGYNTSNGNTIQDAYNSDKEILLEQLNVYNPDIIIFGSTFSMFMGDLLIDKSEVNKSGKFNYAIKNNKVYIDAYHPAYWCHSKENYYNDILRIVKGLKF